MKTLTLMDTSSDWPLGIIDPEDFCAHPDWRARWGFPETVLAVLYHTGVLVSQLLANTLWWKASSGHRVAVCCFTTPGALCGPNWHSPVAPKGHKIAQFHCYIIYLCTCPPALPEVQARVVIDAVCITFCPLGSEGLNQMNTNCEGKPKAGREHVYGSHSLLMVFSPFFHSQFPCVLRILRQNIRKNTSMWNITDFGDLQANLLNIHMKNLGPQKVHILRRSHSKLVAETTIGPVTSHYLYGERKFFSPLFTWAKVIAFQKEFLKWMEKKNNEYSNKEINELAKSTYSIYLPESWKTAVLA